MADKPQDAISALRDLANRWALKAREYARDSKQRGDSDLQGQYFRGMADGYYRAATELAELLKGGDVNFNGAAASAGAAPAAASAPTYAAMDIKEVVRALQYGGVEPREVLPHKDNTFIVVFSRWQSVMDHERRAALEKVDNRIVVLETGKTKDNGDPYIRFAYKPQP